MIPKYLDDPAKWPILANKLRLAGEFGYDTETYGQPQRQSPQHRAKVHCWSVGILTGAFNKRGPYREAVGFVLPVDALYHPDISSVFNDPLIKKWAHNAPHDYHATMNMGVEINGLQDSLQWFRVAFPGMSGYGLKSIAQWALHYEARPSFMDMVSYTKEIVVAKKKRERMCLCNKKGCRKRGDFLSSWGDYLPHERVSWSRFVVSKVVKEFEYSVTDFVPSNANMLAPLNWRGFPTNRWEAWLNYSAEDAIQGIEAVDWLRNQPKKDYKYPWPI